MIETERLLLRKPALEDAEALETPIASLQRWLAEWETNGLGYFTVELGWTLLPEHRGRGYATEAANAARGWAARDGLISLIEPANAASARVAERLGCRAGATVELPDIGPAVVWEHPR